MPALPSALNRSISVSPLRRLPVAIAFVVVLLALLLASVLGYVSWLGPQPSRAPGLFIGAMLAATALAGPALALIWWLDRRERETPWVFFGAFLLGAVVSMGLALLVTGSWGSGLLQSLGLTPADARSFDPLSQITLPLEKIGQAEVLKLGFGRAIVPALIEEAVKLLALLLIVLFLSAEFDSVRDGIVYGALIGLGFTVAETAYYITDGFLRSVSLSFGQQLAARFYFLGLNGHTLFGALMGAGFGLARQNRLRWMKILAPLAFFVLALAAHVVQNTLTVGVAGMVSQFFGLVGVPLSNMPTPALWLSMATAALFTLGLFYAAVIELVQESGRWERAVLAEELAGEVGVAITPDEYGMVVSERGFSLRAIPGYGDRVSRSIVSAQNELALRKWRVRRAGGDPETDAIVQAWRQDIVALRRTG